MAGEQLIKAYTQKVSFAGTEAIALEDASGAGWWTAVSNFIYKNTNGNFVAKYGNIEKHTINGVDGLYENLIKYGFVNHLEGSGQLLNVWIGFDATISYGSSLINKIKARVYSGTPTGLPVDVMIWDGARNCYPALDNQQPLGLASNRFSTIHLGSSPTVTSDEREKPLIEEIPQEWLDAWGSVEWCRFKYRGDDLWHIGLVAQRVHAAFAAKNIDAFELGLCRLSTWDEICIPEMKFNKEGENVPTGKQIVERVSGDRWSLCYEECLALDAAFQGRERLRARAARADLEARIVALEQLV